MDSLRSMTPSPAAADTELERKLEKKRRKEEKRQRKLLAEMPDPDQKPNGAIKEKLQGPVIVEDVEEGKTEKKTHKDRRRKDPAEFEVKEVAVMAISEAEPNHTTMEKPSQALRFTAQSGYSLQPTVMEHVAANRGEVPDL